MRILIVSNLYPPHYLGGYEIRCAQVAEALQQAGHGVEVITSDYRVTGGGGSARRERRNGVVVHRCLREYIFPPLVHLRPWAYFQARRELKDAHHFQRIVKAFKPDVINWWSMLGISKLLLPLPSRWAIPEVYWIEQSWLIDQVGIRGSLVARIWHDFWDGNWGIRGGNALTRAIGRRWEARAIVDGIETRNFGTPPGHVCFVSRFMARRHLEAGLTLPSSEVIRGGVSIEDFLDQIHEARPAQPLHLLYAGQLTPDRGLDTLVEALGMLAPQLLNRVTLRVAGEGQPDFLEGVMTRVKSLGLSNTVSFAGRVPHAEMPVLFRSCDIQVFPSRRDEGLPLSMIEAMLSGCAVVTTGAGGAGEIAELAQLPTFGPGDPASLAALLAGLIEDRAEVSRIAARGQDIAAREFGFDQMFARFMSTLQAVAVTGSR